MRLFLLCPRWDRTSPSKQLYWYWKKHCIFLKSNFYGLLTGRDGKPLLLNLSSASISFHKKIGGQWLVCQTPEREVGGSIPTSAVLCHILCPKVLVIPKKRWLCPDMTEKLFTGTLSNNETKRNKKFNLAKTQISLSIHRTILLLTQEEA